MSIFTLTCTLPPTDGGSETQPRDSAGRLIVGFVPALLMDQETLDHVQRVREGKLPRKEPDPKDDGGP